MRVPALLCLAAWAFAAEPQPAVPVTALAFSPDGRTLVSGGYKQIHVWDLTRGKLARTIGGLGGTVRTLAFRADGRMLVAAEGVPGRSGAVALIDLENGAETVLDRAKDEVLAAAFSPDGKLVAAGGTDSVVKVWNGGDKTLTATLKDHNGWISGLAFSPDGKLLATASADRTVQIWDTKVWKSILRLPQTLTDVVNGVAFSPEGDLLAFAVGGDDERAIRLWRTQNAFVEVDSSRPGQRNAIVQTRPLDTGACLPLAVAWIKPPLGAAAAARSRLVAGCADNTLKLMGPGGNVFATMTDHTDWVYVVAASPDGMRIASGSGDGTVKLWGPAGRLLATLREGPQP